MNGKYIPFVPIGYTGGPNDTSILPPSRSNQTQAGRGGHQDPNIAILRDIIEIWLCTPITVLGVLGNLVSLVVLCYMRKGKLRAVATMLQALAVSDTLVLLASFWLRTLRYLAGQTFVYYHAITFPVFFSTNYVLRLVNTWITVLLTFDRYVAVCHPLHAQSLCTTKRTYIQIVCVIVTSFAFCVPRYFESKLVYTPTPDYRTTWLMDDPLYAVVYRILLFLIVQYILPMIILIALNGRVVWSLRLSSANQPRFSRNRPQKYSVTSLKNTHNLLQALVISNTHYDKPLANTQDASARTPGVTYEMPARSHAVTNEAPTRPHAVPHEAPARSPGVTYDVPSRTLGVTNEVPARTPGVTRDELSRTPVVTHDVSARSPVVPHDTYTSTQRSSTSSVATIQDATANSTAPSQHASARTLTRIVMAVVLLCIVCHVVSMVSHVLHSVQTAFHQLPGLDLCRRYFSNISNLLITFNSAVNFLIYCALSRNFRAILDRCLKGAFRRGRHPLRTGRNLYHLRHSTMTASSATKRGGSSPGQSVSTPMSIPMTTVKRSRTYQGLPITLVPSRDNSL